MSDLISRQAAIEVIEKMMEVYWDRKVVLARVWDQIKDLPSAQQWIPCSERQPEETNLYWVTIKVQNSEKLEATQRWYFGRGYGDGWEAELYEPPLAWMPMEWPEPWRRES